MVEKKLINIFKRLFPIIDVGEVSTQWAGGGWVMPKEKQSKVCPLPHTGFHANVDEQQKVKQASNSRRFIDLYSTYTRLMPPSHLDARVAPTSTPLHANVRWLSLIALGDIKNNHP